MLAARRLVPGSGSNSPITNSSAPLVVGDIETLFTYHINYFLQRGIFHAKILLRDNIPCSLFKKWARDQKEVRDMSKYELAVVVSAKLEDEGRAALIEKVKELITRFGGNVTKVDEWGKKKLAYEIQKMNEAFYYFVYFESENTDCPNEMEAQMRIMDNVLRYLVVKEDEE